MPAPQNIFENDEEIEESDNLIIRIRKRAINDICIYKRKIKYTFLIIFILLYSIYFGYCLSLSFNDNIGLFILTCLVLLLIFYINTGKFILKKIFGKLETLSDRIPFLWKKNIKR